MTTIIRSDQLDIGTGPNNIVALDGSSLLPAVDGSQLINLPGGGGLSNVVEDTTPQLGGNLDVNSFNIITPDSSSAADIDAIQLIAGNNSYGGGAYYSGHINVNAGNGTNGNYGGHILMYAGNSDSSGGGYISMYGGTSTSKYGGWFNIQSGNGGGSYNGGYANIQAGDATGTGSGGNVFLRGGGSVSGTGGDVILSPGTGPSGGRVKILRGGGAGGDISFETNNGSAGVAEIRLWRHTNTGHTTGNFVALKSSSSLVSDLTLTLPIADGSSGDVLITNGSGELSFVPNSDLGEFTVAGLPTASSNANSYALATNASGGRTIVRSDGTNWKVVVVEGATVTT